MIQYAIDHKQFVEPVDMYFLFKHLISYCLGTHYVCSQFTVFVDGCQVRRALFDYCVQLCIDLFPPMFYLSVNGTIIHITQAVYSHYLYSHQMKGLC